VLRRIATGRGLVLTIVAVAAVTVMLWLGQWQWERSRPEVLAAGLPTVDIAEVIPQSGRLIARDQGRRVSVGGTWRPDRQVLVGDRRRPGAANVGANGGENGGENGRWVVTAIEVGTPDGTRLVPVVRGWVPASGPALPPTAPTGAVELEGWVQASEALDVPVTVVQPPGVVSLLAAADLINRWPEQVADGFVIADAAPGVSGAENLLRGAEPLPGPVAAARTERDWRNVAYAGQWWVFAAFAAALWWRAINDSAATASPPVRAMTHEKGRT